MFSIRFSWFVSICYWFVQWWYVVSYVCIMVMNLSVCCMLLVHYVHESISMLYVICALWILWYLYGMRALHWCITHVFLAMFCIACVLLQRYIKMKRSRCMVCGQDNLLVEIQARSNHMTFQLCFSLIELSGNISTLLSLSCHSLVHYANLRNIENKG